MSSGRLQPRDQGRLALVLLCALGAAWWTGGLQAYRGRVESREVSQTTYSDEDGADWTASSYRVTLRPGGEAPAETVALPLDVFVHASPGRTLVKARLRPWWEVDEALVLGFSPLLAGLVSLGALTWALAPLAGAGAGRVHALALVLAGAGFLCGALGLGRLARLELPSGVDVFSWLGPALVFAAGGGVCLVGAWRVAATAGAEEPPT